MASVAKLHNPMATMGLSSQQQAVREAVYKATHRYPKPPKEKYLTVLFTAATSAMSCHDIIDRLHKRVEKKNWATVAKSLYIVHRLFVDGDEIFIDSLKDRASRFFVLKTFSIHNEASNSTTFIKKYGKYLEEKCSVYRLHHFQFEKKKETFKNLKAPIRDHFKIIQKIQSQLNALLNTKLRLPLVQSNLIYKSIFVLLLKDAVRLYSMVNDAILLMMNEYWSLPKADAQVCFDIYKLYVRETDALLLLLDVGRQVITSGVPDIGKLDASILTSMEKYLDGLTPGSSKRLESSNKDMDLKVDSSSSQESNGPEANSGSESDDGSYSGSNEDDDQLDAFVLTLKQNFQQPSLQVGLGMPGLQPPLGQPMPVMQPMGVQPQPYMANPFATGTAGNPFATSAPANPFATSSAGFGTTTFGSGTFAQPGVAPSNPFATNNPFATSSAGAFGATTFGSATFSAPQTTVVVQQTTTTQPNPFLVKAPSSANPFAQ